MWLLQPPYCLCINSVKKFVQFDLNTSLSNDYVSFIDFGHPDLIFETRHGAVPVYTDCTFHCVPMGFAQLLILMVYLDAYKKYIPIFYVLLPNKKYETYRCAMSLILAACNWQLRATTYTIDYEVALQKLFALFFPQDENVSCFFHFKQAIVRQLEQLRIPGHILYAIAGTNGLIDLLTVIDPLEVVCKGIPYIKSKLAALELTPECKLALARFWRYFLKIWCNGRYQIASWNVSRLDPDSIVNRTNNALERFNRTLKERLLVVVVPHAHPSMAQFLETIKQLSHEHVQELAALRGSTQLPRDTHRPPPLL